MVEIDKTDTINSILCGEFATALTINFHGFESLANGVGEDFPWKFSKNGRFNIPVYGVSTTTWLGHAHAINSVLIGDNPFEFNDWYFIDPFFEEKVNPGDWNMANNNNVVIHYFPDMNPEDGGVSGMNIIRWFLDEDGNPSLIEAEPYLVPSNPNKDTIPPEISLSIPDSSFHNSNVNLEYLVKENQTFLDSAYYELNGVRTNIECSVPYYSGFIGTDSISGTIPLASEEGEYDLIFYANDMAKPQGNESILNRYFVIDKTPPTTSDNAPEAWQNSDFEVVLTPSDALSGVASTKYCISSTNDCIPNIEYSGPVLISEEGIKYFRYFSTDNAGNDEPIVSRETKLDKTASEIEIIYPKAQDYVGSVDSMVVKVSDAYPGDTVYYNINGTDYSVAYSDTITVNTTSVEGQNTYSVSAPDQAENPSTAEVNFNVIPDAVEKKTLEDHFKAYPNPVSDVINFEFYLQTPQNLRFSISDITGRQLEQRVIEGNAGENKVSYDVSEYKSGVYIYRFEGPEGKTKTGKIFKK